MFPALLGWDSKLKEEHRVDQPLSRDCHRVITLALASHALPPDRTHLRVQVSVSNSLSGGFAAGERCTGCQQLGCAECLRSETQGPCGEPQAGSPNITSKSCHQVLLL